MALQNGSGTALTKLSVAALNWLSQTGEDAADPTVDTVNLEPAIIVPADTVHTWSYFKAGGLSDDAAMAAAITQGGTLVIDSGLSIHLTRTFTITTAMQIISNESQTVGGSVITDSSTGGVFRIAAPTPGAAIAPVLFQGLNIINNATSGSIIVMSGDHAIINECQFANVAGNSSTMVEFQGYDQVIENSTFTNYEPTAYCWSATWVDGYDGVDGEPVNDRIVGGSAFGPGMGGLISNAGLHFTEGFSIDDWICATQGVQVQASDVYSLEIRGGAFDGATGSAIVLGGGNALVQSVVIQGAYISAAGDAIDAAPSSGSGVNDLTVQDNQISGGGTGIVINGASGHTALIGNTITSSSLGLSLQNPASQVLVIDNTVSGGGVSLSGNSANPNQVFFGNTINGPLNTAGSTGSNAVFTSNGVTGLSSNATAPVSVVQAVQAASSNVSLPDFTESSIASAVGAFAVSGLEETFSHFKNPAPGIVLTDDQAFAAAIAALGPVHGTLVIDNDLTIDLTQTVEITNPMTIVSAGSGLDTSSLITTTAVGGMFQISSAGSVLIQGLNLKGGSSGSIVTTGTGNTVLRDDEFTNVAGNASSMVVLQGADQLIQDSYFENSVAAAYDWSAAYISSGTAAEPSTTISGGWAYGIGKGGLIGGNNAGPAIQGFDIDNWTIVGGGATQVEADNVSDLDIEGGVFDGSTGSAIVLGGGATRISSVTVNGAFISAAGAAAIDPTTGIAINAGLATGGGVANLTVTDNQINTVGTGLLVGEETGNVTVSGNDLRTGKVGLDLTSPTGNVVVVGNQDNPNSGTIAVQSTAAIGSTQTYVANTFNGAVLIDQTDSTPTLLDNIGSGTTGNAVAISTAALNATITSATPAQVTALPANVVAALSSSEIAALTQAQVGALTTAQIGALTPAQMGAMTSTDVAALTVTQVGALTTAQLKALSPLQMVGFNPSQLAAMSTGQLETLTSSQFGHDYLFDASYYLAQYPNVAESGVDPYQQYMTVGWKEGYNPSPFFNTDYYLEENPAVQAAGVNPLAQFEISGWNGSTDPSAAFSDSKYLAANPDVAAANMDPLLHYVISGQFEGRAVFASSQPDPLLDLTATQIALLTTTQVAGLTSADIGALTASQVGALTSAQLGALGTSQLTGLTTSEIGALTAIQLAGLTSTALGTLTTTQLGSLTSQQLGALTTTQLAGLTAAQVAGLTRTQLQGLTSSTLQALPSLGGLLTSGVTIGTASSSSTVNVNVAEAIQAVAVEPVEPNGTISLFISEMAWEGDAQFSVTVDGVAVGGKMTAVASHAAGQSEQFSITGAYSSGVHLVGVTLLNSLGGLDGGRALFVDGMSYDGQDVDQSASLTANGTALLSTSPTPQPTAITFNLSEDAYNGDAIALISIDGKVQGGPQLVQASHTAGNTQSMTFQVDLAPGEHTGSITLLNGIAGTMNSTRDLFVDSVSVAGSLLNKSLTSSVLNTANITSYFAFNTVQAENTDSALVVSHGVPTAHSLLIPSS